MPLSQVSRNVLPSIVTGAPGAEPARDRTTIEARPPAPDVCVVFLNARLRIMMGPSACGSMMMWEYPAKTGGSSGSAASIVSGRSTISTEAPYSPGRTCTVPPGGAIDTVSSRADAVRAVPNRVRWYVWITLSPPESRWHSPDPPSCACTAAVSSASHTVAIGTIAPLVLFT